MRTATESIPTPRTRESPFGRCIKGEEPINTSAKKGEKNKKKKDIKDLRNFKNKIEGQVLGDVLVPKNLDKD